MASRRINFVTTNPAKFAIAEGHLVKPGDSKITLVHYDSETPELQNLQTESVARSSALWISGKLGEAAITSDVGFAIDCLNGFPGPFVKYINRWLTAKDILSMMVDRENRSASYVHAIAYAEPNGDCEVFTSTTYGTIVKSEFESLPQSSTTDIVFIPKGFYVPLGSLEEEERALAWNNDCWDRLVTYIET